MEKTEKTQTHHLITDFKSLEDESLTLLGLDVDEALENSKDIGIKIKQRTVLLQSIFAIIVLILVIGTSAFLTFRANEQSTSDSIKTADVKVVDEANVANQTQTKIDEKPASGTTNQQPFAAFVFPEFETGNSALCNTPAATPDENGITVGSSSIVEKFNPSTDGDTFSIVTTPGIVNVTNSQVNGGQYIIFGDGAYTNENYRKQSTSGLTYCDSTKRVDVTYSNNGYLVQTETY